MVERTEQVNLIGDDIYCRSEDRKYSYLYSQDRRYRYSLEARVCDNAEKDGAILFIMLNPGTEKGGEERKNHTTRKNCERFTREQGYGTLWTCNLFAFRASDSGAIKNKSHIGENNNSYVLKYARQAEMIMCAWGNAGGNARLKLDRSQYVREMLSDNGLSYKTYHLGLNKTLQPKHPMRLAKNTQPIPYRPPWNS